MIKNLTINEPLDENDYPEPAGLFGAAVGATLGGLVHDVTDGYAAVIALALGAISIPVVIFWTVPELRAAGRWRR